MTEVADIWALVEPYLAAERLELDDLELSGRGRGRVLRVTVDGEGVDLERLAELSRGLSRLLDDEPALQDSYQLEVSSPGLERKLRRPSHFSKSIGREVVVKTAAAGAKTTHRGTLSGAGERSFTVESEEGPVTVAYDDVASAKTVYRWEKAPKPGHSKENS
ncbi:MAG TPA: ribosome maturation factor RimP [Acidimicrobiia bacterium]|nr:ribosome maturation factor RimP [Acidimicrobiia bacterium]